MSTMTPQNAIWSTMPGWGIAADLTPPELIASRQLHQVRRMMALALALVFALCVLGFALAWMKQHSASSALDKQDQISTQLNAQQRKYDDVVRIQGSVADVQNKIATLMKDDVDFASLTSKIRSALPPGMTISQMAVNLVVSANPVSAAAGTTGTIDTSGNKHIGAITLSGSGLKATDVAAYIDKLKAIDGVVEVLPTSNTVVVTGVQYNLTLTVTDELLTHKYDLKPKGTK